MFVRKSGRISPNDGFSPKHLTFAQELNSDFLGYASQESQKQFEQELQQQELHQQRYFNSPQIQQLAEEAKEFVNVEKIFTDSKETKEEEKPHDKNASATTKALSEFELDSADKKKWKKGVKIPTAAKRKRWNQRLSKILTPKSALILLHELKPGCVYKIQEQEGCFPSLFFAEVELNGQVLGVGQGTSKSQAKNHAAENAIKGIVSKTMWRCSEAKEEGEGDAEEEKEDTPENLPWAGLASFAIYKMFNEWQNEGSDPSPSPVTKITKPTKPIVTKKKSLILNAPTKKDLPANANELHPAVVLNMVNPGLIAIELEREDAPKCRVKMAYLIDGKTYSGVGGNKKDAKKEAAKAVLEGLYGLRYR